MTSIRLYKFYPLNWAKENLKERQLKVSILNELNDPFEMNFFNLPDASQRKAWDNALNEVMRNKGVICFSDRWSNPVLWSHYADSHRGLAIGFDVPQELVAKVTYSSRRPALDFAKLSHSQRSDAIRGFTHTKFSHWRYESESRIFPALEECINRSGLYFFPMEKIGILREIVIGARSPATSHELRRLVDLPVDILTSRLAFRRFRVCRQMRRDLQK